MAAGPVIPPRVRRAFPRPPAAVLDRLSEVPLAVLSDIAGRIHTGDGNIRPLYPDAPRLIGSALTVRCAAGDNAGVKPAIALSQPGDVLVVDGQGFDAWCLGGFRMVQAAVAERGLRGVMVNGAWRDAADFRAAQVPLYGRALAPWSGPKGGPAEINTPVVCGGLVVDAGDIVVADADGLVVIPRHGIPAVLARLDNRPTPDPDLDARRDAAFWADFAARGGIETGD